MAKITDEQRNFYHIQIKHYKNKIESIKSEINKLKLEMHKEHNLEPITKFKISNLIINLITYFCSMNEISVHLMDVKNTGFLEKARQQVYEVIINIENIVSSFLNVPFSEYSEQLELLDNIPDIKKLNFIKKLGYAIDLVKEDFGENTKWKWSFVEIDGRFAIISKNLFDLKKYMQLDDPHENGYQERKEFFNIIQRLLNNASEGYREKYSLTTKKIEDLIKAIEFQKALLRLNQLTGDNHKIDTCKKCIEVWSNMLEKQLAEKEEQEKIKKMSK